MHMLSLNLKSQNGSKNKSSYLQKQFLQKMHCDLMIVRYGLGRCTLGLWWRRTLLGIIQTSVEKYFYSLSIIFFWAP